MELLIISNGHLKKNGFELGFGVKLSFMLCYSRRTNNKFGLGSEDRRVSQILKIKQAQTGNKYSWLIVKLRRGSGKDRQGMALKAKGLKA